MLNPPHFSSRVGIAEGVTLHDCVGFNTSGGQPNILVLLVVYE